MLRRPNSSFYLSLLLAVIIIWFASINMMGETTVASRLACGKRGKREASSK